MNEDLMQIQAMMGEAPMPMEGGMPPMGDPMMGGAMPPAMPPMEGMAPEPPPIPRHAQLLMMLEGKWMADEEAVQNQKDDFAAYIAQLLNQTNNPGEAEVFSEGAMTPALDAGMALPPGEALA